MKSIFIYIIFLNICFTGYNQTTQYPFLKTDSNYFLLWQTNSSCEKLFEKFNRLQICGDEQIRILHIGDSHIQSDIFTNQVRRHFAEHFFHLIGPPAIGFPYHLLNASQPITLKVLCTGNWNSYTSNPQNNHAVLGFDAYTTDSCAHKIMVEINNKAIQNVNFNTLKIITNTSNNAQFKNPLITNCIEQKINDTVSILTFKLNDFVDSIILNLRIDSLSQPFKLYGIVPENDDPGIVYHIAGINGAKASTFSKTLLPYFIKHNSYDWIIISLGTNDVYSTKIDSSFITQNFQQLIKSIKTINPDVSILLTTPMEHYYKKQRINHHVEFVREVIFSVAQYEHCAVWDFYQVAGGKGSADQWYNANLMKADKLHLNIDGYHLMANLFFEAFMNTYVNGFLAK